MRIQDRFNENWPAEINVGPGWIPLVHALDDTLAYVSPHYQIQRITQKAGALRFYATYIPRDGETNTETARSAFYSMIKGAELRSHTICETCGLPGTLKHHNTNTYIGCATHNTPPNPTMTKAENTENSNQ